MTRSGFTLIEVLIVIGITALLAGLILTYSSQSRDQVALYVEQARLAQTISKAKSLTVSTYNRPEVPCGYGVHVDYVKDTYTLFSYDAPTCDNLSPLLPNVQTILSSHTLPPNLRFASPDAQSPDDIMFIPPNPDTWIWLHGGLTTSTLGRIPLASKSGTLSARVTISSAGQITF